LTERLDGLRGEIDVLSTSILAALNERARRALDVAREKDQLGLPMRDPHRESRLLDRLAEENRGPLDAPTVRALFRSILDASVALMEGRRTRGLQVGSEGGPFLPVTVRGHCIGGPRPVYIAGPCAVESEEQIETAARGLRALGVRFLRAGAFKPRTSPYAFQGLGEAGLRLLAQAARRHGLVSVTEATSPANAEAVAEHADILQIGARNMYNYELLRAVGQTGKPVLLKRAFSATIDEWLNAAEYVALSGSQEIVLCERGIRTFSRETRSTLDLSSVPLARAASRLPVVVDVSHAAGRRDILAALCQAVFGVGAHGVMIEVHPDPDVALSDAEQQLSLDDFAALQRTVHTALRDVAATLAPAAALPRRTKERDSWASVEGDQVP
jgi:3-deoxy-7-phosphoheptulonate synthase/chorismate mutase